MDAQEADFPVTFPPLEKRHWEPKAKSPYYYAPTIHTETFCSNPIVFTSNAGWQPLISVVESHEYFMWVAKYADMVRVGKNGLAESSNLAHNTLNSDYIVGDWKLRPIGFTIHRLGLAFAAVQQNIKSGNMRVMLFGIDYDRYSEYGIAVTPSSFFESTLHESLPCIKEAAAQFDCPIFLEFSPTK
jgi:hypothetical protein